MDYYLNYIYCFLLKICYQIYSLEIKKCQDKDISATGAFYDKVVEYLDTHINYPKWQYKEYPSEEYAKAMASEGFQYQ